VNLESAKTNPLRRGGFRDIAESADYINEAKSSPEMLHFRKSRARELVLRPIAESAKTNPLDVGDYVDVDTEGR
jgi:hypothetical protein